MTVALEPLCEARAAEMIGELRNREAASREAARVARERRSKGHGSPSGEVDTGEQLALAKLLLTAGRFSRAEYVFYVAARAEYIRDRRCFAAAYDAELQPISAAIEEIERAHGLEEDEYFALDAGPEEWRKLNCAYEAVLDDKMAELLSELGLTDLAALHREDKEQFDRLRETGRLAFFRESGADQHLLNLIGIYERETRRAAMAGAWFAANTMLACAAESRLVLHCLRRPDAARAAVERLPDTLRPRDRDPLGWTVEQLVAVAYAGGWLHNLPDARLVAAVAAWLEGAAARRPGQQARDGVQLLLGESELQFSANAYAALRCSLDHAARTADAGETLQ